MGNKQSSIVQPPIPESREESWGEPPTQVPADEKDPLELVIQSWAFCKAKPSPIKHYKSDAEEKARRDGLKWRKRSSFIELDCGEDSFFVSNTYKAIGVADGVGGWRDLGVDPAHFSNSLMENAKLYSETHRKDLNPESILQHAYDKIKRDKFVKAGSSTATVATLVKEGDKHFLDVANIGDSGCLVIRNRQILHRVHELVHGFNAPFQLAILPPHMTRAFSDNVSDAVRERVEVQKGDVIVMGTDGLFDNRFNSHIAADAGWCGKTEESIISKIPVLGNLLSVFFAKYDQEVDYIDPYRVATRLVQDAYKTSLSKEENSPWSSLLRQAGVQDAKGGKVDDITVVLGRIATREEVNLSAQW